MSERRTIFLSIVLGIGIGACLALGSWLVKPEMAQAQCAQLYLFSYVPGETVDCFVSGFPSYGPGTLVSQTMSDPFGLTRYVALCAQ